LIDALSAYAVSQRLCEDEHFVLQRALRAGDGARVLLRTARPGQRACRERLEHEYALRAELDPAWAAQPQALLAAGSALALVLSDPGAAPLSVPAPGAARATAEFLRLAGALAAAVAQLHRRDLVHKDLRPEHILFDPASGQAYLTGFGIAARLGAVPRGPDGHQSGSLAYMAPEQSGRVDRAVDTRSDLYSLGVLLYQQLCGELPFSASDAMQWIHCHVARPAPPPCERRAGVDPACAAIVMKLLEKCAEQRYQSAAGLLADLQHCQAQLAAHAAIAPFALGRSDAAARLQLEHPLIGRAAELQLLADAARQVGAGGAPQLLLLSGPAGSGKSALLGALQHSTAVSGALVLSASFEQQQGASPYAGLARAFDALLLQMQAASAPALACWRGALQRALGAQAGVLTELIAQLGALLGPQEAPPPLPAREAEARLHASFRQFIGALCGGDAMLLLCLDDLQWIDAASLKLLTELVGHAELRRMLVVGAYRNTNVGPGDPLALAHERLRRQGALVRLVPLHSLTQAEAGELVAAALDCPHSWCAPLAALVYAKALGNPYFTLQFLTRLAESALLRYEHAQERWVWDAQAIGAKQFSDNVVDLMVARLQQLPYATLELLKLLACLGPHASVAMLAQVAGMSAPETDECLWPAARLGLVKRESHAYRFTHERVMEAAYSLISGASLPERHLHIGRALMGAAGSDGLEEQLFAVAGHLNRARAAISAPEELRALAALNVRAGAKARRAVAYDAARHYFAQAVALTPDSAWQSSIDATFALYSALAECEYLCGGMERAGALFALLAEHARNRLELAQVALLRVAHCQVVGRFDQAVAVALEALALFAVYFPDAGDADAIASALEHERAAIARHMGQRAPAQLRHEAASNDPEIITVAALFADIGSSVFSARPALYPLLAAKALHYTLRFGSTPASGSTYARYAIWLVSTGAVDEAFAWSELAQASATRNGPGGSRSGRLSFVHGAYIHCWREPLAASVALLEQAFGVCSEAGDLPHAGYAAHIAVWHSLEAGSALDQVQRKARHYQRFARQQNNEVLLQLLRCYEQFTLCLQGATAAVGSLDDARFCARDALALMERASFGAARSRYQVLRQMAAYGFGQYQDALQAADAAACEGQFFLASVHEASHHLYHALTLAALYPQAAPQRQAAWMVILLDKQQRLRDWAAHCPANFEHSYLLVAAEIARLDRRDGAAMAAYDGALACAAAGGFVQHEALAAELAARFYDARGFDCIALCYARAALRALARWGAYGKMGALEQRYPALLDGEDTSPAAAAAVAQNPELVAALCALRALDAAATPAELAAALVRGACEQAGATGALLLLRSAAGERCVARASADQGGVRIDPCDVPAGLAGMPAALLAQVLRTGETVHLPDAPASTRFAGDPYIASVRPRSLLCIPLARCGEVLGALYLEQRGQAGAFAPDRVLMLELMAAHGAVLFDHARLARLLDGARDEREEREENGRRDGRDAGPLVPVLERNS
jgi:predicted ATPase/GAF domain-containing protein